MNLKALQEEFKIKQGRLIDLLASVSDGVLRTEYPHAKNISELFRQIANILGSDSTLEEKRGYAGSIRSAFHKDGFQDWPGPENYVTWDEDTEELYDLSTIYSERKYIGVVTEQTSGADGV